MTDFLESISIASPCRADWQSMTGNEQVRYCRECQLNVYNLAGMSRTEAEALLQNAEGRVCVRLFRRADGTVLTRDCPVGIQALHRRKISRLHRMAAAVTLVTLLGVFAVSNAEKTNPTELLGGLPAQNTPMMGEPIMGDVALPPSPNTQVEQGRIKMPTDPEKPQPGKPESPDTQPPTSPSPMMGKIALPQAPSHVEPRTGEITVPTPQH